MTLTSGASCRRIPFFLLQLAKVKAGGGAASALAHLTVIHVPRRLNGTTRTTCEVSDFCALERNAFLRDKFLSRDSETHDLLFAGKSGCVRGLPHDGRLHLKTRSLFFPSVRNLLMEC